MIIFKNASSLHRFLGIQKQKGDSIGFVPTMGALHAGHLALIAQSKKEASHTCASIFVNPTQFNDPADFEKYPVTIENDIYLLEKAGCDSLFLPSIKEIYPEGTSHLNNYELGSLEQVLEGKYRPGHFQGVCQVVHRLLEATNPTFLYLGQKDYQQCLVIKKLVQLTGFKVDVRVCATKRESSGLAMSSRNMRLSEAGREKAAALYRELKYVRDHLKPGLVNPLLQESIDRLTAEGFKVDYLSFSNADDLHAVSEWDGQERVVVLVAAFLEGVRLIDNMVVLPPV